MEKANIENKGLNKLIEKEQSINLLLIMKDLQENEDHMKSLIDKKTPLVQEFSKIISDSSALELCLSLGDIKPTYQSLVVSILYAHKLQKLADNHHFLLGMDLESIMYSLIPKEIFKDLMEDKLKEVNDQIIQYFTSKKMNETVRQKLLKLIIN